MASESWYIVLISLHNQAPNIDPNDTPRSSRKSKAQGEERLGRILAGTLRLLPGISRRLTLLSDSYTVPRPKSDNGDFKFVESMPPPSETLSRFLDTLELDDHLI